MRWTIAQLEKTGDMALIDAILQERKDELSTVNSPLYKRLNDIQKKLKTGNHFDETGNISDSGVLLDPVDQHDLIKLSKSAEAGYKLLGLGEESAPTVFEMIKKIWRAGVRKPGESK